LGSGMILSSNFPMGPITASISDKADVLSFEKFRLIDKTVFSQIRDKCQS
jgi:hypothetical protein